MVMRAGSGRGIANALRGALPPEFIRAVALERTIVCESRTNVPAGEEAVEEEGEAKTRRCARDELHVRGSLLLMRGTWKPAVDLRAVLHAAAARPTFGIDARTAPRYAVLTATYAAEIGARPLLGQQICPGELA